MEGGIRCYLAGFTLGCIFWDRTATFVAWVYILVRVVQPSQIPGSICQPTIPYRGNSYLKLILPDLYLKLNMFVRS